MPTIYRAPEPRKNKSPLGAYLRISRHQRSSALKTYRLAAVLLAVAMTLLVPVFSSAATYNAGP